MYVHYIALDSVHDGSFVIDRPCGRIDFLFLHIKTPCTLVINDSIHTIISPSGILLDSNTPHCYFPTGGSYEDDYLHFAPENREKFLSELTFPLNTPLLITKDSFIPEILRLIGKEFTLENKNSSKAYILLINLLMIKFGDEFNLHEQRVVSIPHYDDLLAVRNRIISSPGGNWNIEELAQQAHLSHAYFQVMYKKVFGITCINDVINVKIARAKILLTTTELTIRQVAQELGYNEVYHFIRQFKKATGTTPGAFRKLAHTII